MGEKVKDEDRRTLIRLFRYINNKLFIREFNIFKLLPKCAQ